MDATELLKKLISIDSVYPNEKKIAEFLENYLKELGFEVKRQNISENRFNLLAERGTRGKPVLFYGHMDTVPAYGEWESDPFTLREEGDNLYGLGIWDMKAGIAAILKAVEGDSERRIKIALGVDEENISQGANEIIKSDFLDDVEGVIVTEGGNTKKNHPGPKQIMLGRRGRAVYFIEVFGESAHGASQKGKSAVLVASKIVQFLEEQKLLEHEFLPRASQFVSKVQSEVKGLSIPDYAVIELDRHLVPPETPESILEALKTDLHKFEERGVRVKVGLKNRETNYLAPYITERENEFVQRIARVIRERYGEVIYDYGLSVADENIFASRGLPVVTIGAEGGEDHSSKEWLSKKSYLELIEVLRSIIE